MTTYEWAKVILGCTTVMLIILGALIGYIISLERRLSTARACITELDRYLHHNIPDLIDETLALRCETSKLLTHAGISQTVTDPHRIARLSDARKQTAQMLAASCKKGA